MSLSVITSAENGTTSSFVLNISTSPVTWVAGDLAVVMIRWYNNTGQTISSVSIQATSCTQADLVTTAAPVACAIYYLASVTPGAGGVTVTFSASVSYADVILYQVRGAATANPLDTIAHASSATAVSSLTPSITTTNANDIIFAFSDEDALSSTISFPGGWTARGMSPSGGNFCNAAYQIFSSIQSGLGVTSTFTSSGSGVAMLASFKALPTSAAGYGSVVNIMG